MSQIKLGFIPEPITLSTEKILPSRKLPANLIDTKKYKQIVESIRSIGLIEPLSVGHESKESGLHILLDGHTRIEAMKELGITEALCLVAIDDESYTYNNRVNRLSTVQEHLMIKRAINRGVSPERLAKSLNIDISNIMKKVRLLDGICAEAAELLRDQIFSANISSTLRKMKPTRQVECVELMISTNNITITYADALLAASPASMLIDEFKPNKIRGVSAELMVKMEREMGNLQDQYKLVEESYGQDVLNLVLAKGFLVKLLDNQAVSRYIKQFEPDVHSEFMNIIETVSLDK